MNVDQLVTLVGHLAILATAAAAWRNASKAHKSAKDAVEKLNGHMNGGKGVL